jgi:hypothetical protein
MRMGPIGVDTSAGQFLLFDFVVPRAVNLGVLIAGDITKPLRAAHGEARSRPA